MLNRISKCFCDVCITLCVLILITITGFALMQVVGRYVFHHTFFWVEEITTMLLGWVVALGAPALWLLNEHVIMDAINSILPKKLIFWWDAVIQLLAVVAGVVLLAAGLKAYRLNSGFTISLLRYDESVKFIFVPVLGTLLAIAATLSMIRHLTQDRRITAQKEGGEA